jgi:hypothetical protein
VVVGLLAIVWAAFWAALVFGLPVVQQHLYLPGTDFDPAYRANAIQVIRGEITRLAPAYDGSISTGMDEYNAPGRPVGIIAFYSLEPDQCSSVLTYYATRVPQAGWLTVQPITTHTNPYTGVVTTFSAYRTTAQGLALRLDIDCDSTASYGYELGIFVA